MNVDRDYVDCDTGTVVQGIRQSDSGQVVRLYYVCFGSPSANPGEIDPGKRKARRVLTLRAVEAIEYPGQKPPTIILKDEEGKQYVYMAEGHVDPKYAEFAETTLDPILVDYGDSDTMRGEDMRKIGCDIALAVPDDSRMSPQLK